jgi:phosphatidylglycerophosphate synthase
MTAYEPPSRRPIASVFRGTAAATVRFCVARGIHPDVVSYLSIVASIGAGACFWRAGDHPALLIVAPLLCYVRLWLNMLDGMVALAAGNASPRGEILNDLPDRISDVAIFVGVAHSGLCSPFTAYWAAIFALLTAYVATLGQAVGTRREFSGAMSKPWRMVVLHIGAWVALGMDLRRGQVAAWLGFSILDWTCLVVIAGCVETIVVRLRRILRSVAEKAAPSGRRST